MGYKHYKTAVGAVVALADNGMQDNLITNDMVLMTDAEFEAYRNPQKTAAQIAYEQIAAIELTITPRRLREALLGIDGGWLASRDAEISAIRAAL